MSKTQIPQHVLHGHGFPLKKAPDGSIVDADGVGLYIPALELLSDELTDRILASTNALMGWTVEQIQQRAFEKKDESVRIRAGKSATVKNVSHNRMK
jgi:hypothetical protein